MTREQARREIDSLDYYLQNHTDDYGEESHTAMMMAIQALQAQADGDLVSRQAVLDAIKFEDKWLHDAKGHNKDTEIAFHGIYHSVNSLPTVAMPSATGHWKRISMDKYTEHAQHWYRCDRCGKDNLGNTDWCPNCGADMRGEQE